MASRGCPCPVCNVPVTEFIKLFLSGDTSESETLRKELKLVKRRLAKERAQLQHTQKQLMALTEAEREDSQAAVAGPSRKELSSSRRQLENDIQELCATAALLLGDSPKQKAKSKRKPKDQARPSYRRHESAPLQSSPSFTESLTESLRSLLFDPPSTSNSITMPPAPTSSRPSSNRERNAESRTESPRRRRDEAHHYRNSPNRSSSIRLGRPSSGPYAPNNRRSNSSQPLVVYRPDPPTPPPASYGDPVDVSGPNNDGYAASPEPPSCRPRGEDSAMVIARQSVRNAPTPTRRRPLVS